MGIENTLVKGTGLKQAETQQYRVAHAGPDGCADVVDGGDVLHQHCVDGHADDDEKRLEAQGQQRSEIILPHVAPFLSQHGRHGNGRDGSHKINLDHASIDHNEDADGDGPGA